MSNRASNHKLLANLPQERINGVDEAAGEDSASKTSVIGEKAKGFSHMTD